MVGRRTFTGFLIFGLCACRAEQAPDNAVDRVTQRGIAGSAEKVDSVGPQQAAPAAGHSQFTSIDPDSCKLIEQNVEEGGWSRRLCRGVAGYQLELTDSDLRQDIIVIPSSGQRRELGLTEIVANGAFNALGKAAEWRGADPSKPDMLIVRLGVAADAEATKPDISNLVVARLQPSACIVAIVPPGAAQNERARAIADGQSTPCLRR